MSDELPAGSGESDIRRRAAWLLVMLALVAALFVALMVTFLGTSGGKHNGTVSDIAAPPSTRAASSHSHPSSTGHKSTSRSSGSASTSGPGHNKTLTCPSDKPCVAGDDIGNAVAAVNAYRTQHGQPAVPGSVSDAAKTCALNNGSGCSGGWAETLVPTHDGAAAVTKILRFGKLLSAMKSFAVGWAYDPGSKQYYFAIIRNS